MPLFFVYIQWSRNPLIHRSLLVCQSRYLADELFRALEERKLRGTEQLLFSVLERATPQLWFYDSIDGSGWDAIEDFLREKPLQFLSTVMISRIPDGDSGGWALPIIPIDDRPDWVHNGTYYIRSTRQPNIYWERRTDYIYPSIDPKTKFRVRLTGTAKSKVLVRDDEVDIHIAETNSLTDIKCETNSEKRVITSADPTTWKFGDLIGGFRTGRERLGSDCIVWTTEKDGVEWELC
jgi:hypothetical protein